MTECNFFIIIWHVLKGFIMKYVEILEDEKEKKITLDDFMNHLSNYSAFDVLEVAKDNKEVRNELYKYLVLTFSTFDNVRIKLIESPDFYNYYLKTIKDGSDIEKALLTIYYDNRLINSLYFDQNELIDSIFLNSDFVLRNDYYIKNLVDAYKLFDEIDIELVKKYINYYIEDDIKTELNYLHETFANIIELYNIKVKDDLEIYLDHYKKRDEIFKELDIIEKQRKLITLNKKNYS